MPFGDLWASARYASVLDFRLDRLFSERHAESGFGNGKGGGGRKLGLKLRHAGNYEKAWFCGERSRRLAGVGNGTFAG